MASPHSFIEPDDLKSLLAQGAPLLDMRAPVEFFQGAAPYAYNTPLLNDEERERIGITYKEHGQQAAIELGHQLVSGLVKESRVQSWITTTKGNGCVALYCARGGLRSEISQQWLLDSGVSLPRVRGGYKTIRQQLLHTLNEVPGKERFLIITGKTGAGKTHFLHRASEQFPVIDLEGIAKHRGSAFGDVFGTQPSQATFENEVAQKLLFFEKRSTEPILIEDESRMVGKNRVPDPFFTFTRKSKVIEIEMPFLARVDSIINDYVTELPGALKIADESERLSYLTQFLKRSIMKISNKLGGVRTQTVLADVEEAMFDYAHRHDPSAHRKWVSFLLEDYYDRHYVRHITSSRDRIIFSGTPDEVMAFIASERLF